MPPCTPDLVSSLRDIRATLAEPMGIRSGCRDIAASIGGMPGRNSEGIFLGGEFGAVEGLVG